MWTLSMMIKANTFGIIVLTITIINMILLLTYISKTNSEYRIHQELLRKLGNGDNIYDMIRNYIEDVETIKEQEERLNNRCSDIENNLEKCIQKVGVVRYSTYNKGSDLCFAIALLDFEDNGVVINGVYSRDNTTSTYAKPITSGASKYTLTKEEQDAIDIAKNSGYKYYMKV